MKIITSLLCLLISLTTLGQDLDPRAYVKLPINGTVLIAGYAHSNGSVTTDPTLPFENVEAKVNSTTIGVAHTFKLAGQSAQALVVLPYSWLNGTALMNDQMQSVSRTGFADMRVRLSVLLLNGKAVTVHSYAKDSSRTFVGASLTVVVPTGQYFSNKIVNIGTSRWSFKPEIAFTQKFTKRWMIDLYSGIWFFTANNSFYPGGLKRTQDPLATFQAHLSYNITPRAWAAFNSTFYAGGQSKVDNVIKDDRQSNVRLSATLAVPIGNRSVLKFAYSSGAIVRVGADFHTISVGWSSTWFGKSKADE